MKKLRDFIGGIKNFIGEIRTELRKCAWPTRPELMQSTVMVIVASAIFGIYIGFSDLLLHGLLRLILE